MLLNRLLLLALLSATAPLLAAKDAPQPDALTLELLRPAEFEAMAISPDGSKLAIARLDATGTMPKTQVVIHNLADLKPTMRFDPGTGGAITSLDWLDDQRLIVGATRIDSRYAVPIFEPILVIANLDGSRPLQLPGRFYGSLRDDPDHILVETCTHSKTLGACDIPEVRKTDIKHLYGKGELLLAGPPKTELYVDPKGKAAVAFEVDEDDGRTRTYVYNPAKADWKLINDGFTTGLDVVPLGIRSDGSAALLQVEREQGPDLVEAYNPITGERKPLYTDAESSPVWPIFSFDEEEVIGAYYQPTQPRLHLFQPDHPDAQLRLDLQAALPGRIIVANSMSKDRNLVVLYTYTDRDPGAFVLFDRKTMKLTQLARAKPWIDPDKQASQRGISFKSRDGQTLHGLLTLPPGSNGKNLPLVVLPHGGPHGVVDEWGYDPELQILGQHGYAVLQVNFRGSGGYGRHFDELGERQWGRKMQDDVTDATRWALAEGVADPARVCIYGASYGGYAALMGVIREPALYRCAVGVSGVFDLAKMYKWGDIRRSDYGKNYLKRVLGEDKAELAANSPVALADRIQVPVLLMHGELDDRVPVAHAVAMEKALEKAGKPVELVRYSRTGHSIFIDKHERDFYARLLAFLDAHIGPSAARPPVASTARATAYAASQ